MSRVLDELLGLEDVSRLAGISSARLRQLIVEGRLAATKVSGSWIVKGSDLLPFMDQDRRAGRPRIFELFMEQDSAHIGTRGGGLIALCGKVQNAAWTHSVLEPSDIRGVPLCAACCELCPRYVVRYWRGRGAR
jgi:hypothetical protein